MKTLKKLVPAIAAAHHLTIKQADAIVADVARLMGEALVKEGEFSINDFGRLVVKQKAARTGRNPQTGKEIAIPARKGVSFKPSSVLLEKLNTK